MRILLQSFETGLYLGTSGDWTNTPALAQNFRDTRQAAEFKIHRRLAHAFVVVQPDTAPPVNSNGAHDERIMRVQKTADPVDCRVKTIQAKMIKEGRSVPGKSALAKRPKGLNRHPCNFSV
jgi:hypothetical protein